MCHTNYKQEAHGACIAHLFSPPKLFKGFCYTNAKYQYILTSDSWEDFWRFIKKIPHFPPYCDPKWASPFIWTNPNPHPQACFLPRLLCKSLSTWGGAIHDPRDFIWTNLNLLVSGMLHAKYQCIPAGGSWEEDLSNLSLFCPLLDPKRGQPL